MKTIKPVNIQSVPAGIGVGILVSLFTTLIGTGILSWMLSGEKLQENAQDYGTVLILLLSSIAGAGTSVIVCKAKRLIVSLLAGIGYFLFLLACTALFFGGQYQRIGVTALVILAGSLGVVLVGQVPAKKHTSTRHKYKNR